MTDEQPTKVEIAVAGHTITVESADPLDTVSAKALELFRATEESARRIPTGFAATTLHLERADLELDEYAGVGWKP